VLASSCRTSLDYRLLEKRFVYRQVLSIYDSKLSDSELNLLVLDLIFKTCKCKYALIDLIKRHYLLVWLTNAFEKFHVKNQNLNSNQFKKLLRIFVLIWQELGQSESSPNDELLPITFLNQMSVCARVILNKMSANFKAISTNEHDESKEQQKSFQIGEILKDVFKCNRQIHTSIQKYNFNLFLEQNEMSLSQKLNELVLSKWNDESMGYDLIISELKSRKRKMEQLHGGESKEGESSNKKLKS
jgi:hypothetical protein